MANERNENTENTENTGNMKDDDQFGGGRQNDPSRERVGGVSDENVRGTAEQDEDEFDESDDMDDEEEGEEEGTV
jgi:hypothetical protein